MRIVQAMVAKGYGGAERYFVDLSNYLADQGHKVLAVTHNEFRGKQQLSNNSNLEVVSFSVLGWWDVRSRLAMQKTIKRFKADVMHAHLARASYLCGHISNSLAVPLTVKTHNYIDLKYYRQVDMFISTTQDQKRYLMEQGITAGKVEVIPNFSKINPLEKVLIPNKQEPLTFYAIGRMVKKKGFDILLRAFSKVLKEGYIAKLAIAGDGPELDSLKQLCKDLSIDDHVSLVGWVDDIDSFLKDKDVFILPSLDEPFGIVVLEAMAKGKAIISTRTQGPREILNENTACLVSINSESELSEAIVQLINNEDLRSQLAGEALLKFKGTYSQEKVVPRILDIYKRLAQG